MLFRFILFIITYIHGLHLVSAEPIPLPKRHDGRRHTRRSERIIVPRSHKILERHEKQHLDGWIKRDLADAEAVVPVRIGLRHKGKSLEDGERLLMDISNPKSVNYGKHLSAKQVIEFFAPEGNVVEEVKEWLVGAGVEEGRIGRSGNKQWLQFDAPVREVEELLFTRFHEFEHPESGVVNIACSEYHIPGNISHHIDYVTPGIKLMSLGYDEKVMKRMHERRTFWGKGNRRPHGKGKTKSNKNSGSKVSTVEPDKADENEFKVTGGCDVEVTPQCIRNQYQIPSNKNSRRGNELGIFQSLNQHYNQIDMNNYFKYVSPWVPNNTHPILRSINGAYGPTDRLDLAGEEANLDFQVAIPLIHPQKTILFQTDDEWYQQDQQRPDTRYTGFFNTFFDALDGSYCTLPAFNETGNCSSDSCRDPEYPNPNSERLNHTWQKPLMCGEYTPTNVISISYSGFESAWPENYMRRQCLEILKLSLQGVTVVESSGDYGVGGRQNNPKAGCLGPERDVFSPRTMSNCPYVLSVGATTLKSDLRKKNKFVETAPERFASGGGFSNVFMRPPWQVKAVDTYLKRAGIDDLGYNVTAVAEEGATLFTGGKTGNGWLGGIFGGQRGKVFNKGGRGYPDVAAIGDNYHIVLRGYADRISGTSVAAPVWGSILTLINEERMGVGKGPVGFVHQVLYEHPEVFTDITQGSNPGCGSQGFQVKEGWDPVTGLG
ncbi:putative protease [Podospora fimiseda]|uniref:Protease n=1 Tax=Podospora fimiseda TaxID=252190 RepID=A0AAN7H5J8_9PEZI|nr:putative protease [Podospora fimiseda]